MQVTGLKEFYYYEGIVSVDEAYVMGRNFGNVLRAYEKNTVPPCCTMTVQPPELQLYHFTKNE